MPDKRGRDSKYSRRRSRSRSRSQDYGHQRSSHKDNAERRGKDGLNEDRGNRHRSRSRDRKRKRRSLSPDDGSPRRSHRKDDHRRPRDERRSDRDRTRPKNYSHSRSPPRRTRDFPEPFKRSKGPLPSQTDAFKVKDGTVEDADALPDKQKPNFGTTGRLAAASNTVQASGGQTIVLKYHEPPEARKPSAKDPWRMYVFKGDEIVDTVELAEQSCWLFGRETAVADFLIEHPSCSKQHAVIQFRYMEKRNEFGDKTGRVRPYVIDLESANGTLVNDEKIPEGRYVELRDKDVIKFGHSSRDYVMQLPSAG